MRCPLCRKETRTVIAEELRDGTKQRVRLCRQCELGMLDSERSAEDLKNFYTDEYRSIGKPRLASETNPAELFETHSQFQADRLKLLKPYFSKKKRLLEVGCSAGMFLYHVKPHFKEIVGIDYDKASAQFASKKCACIVYTDDIEKTPLMERSFDIICLFQTLEHVKDPKEFISRLKKYLKPGGIIAVEVPNLYSVLAHVYDLPFHRKFFFHGAHLSYFTEKSLKKLMSACGFTGRVTHLQDYNIVNHMNWIINDKPQPDCLPGLSKVTLPLRTGVPSRVGKKLTDFMVDTDARYRELLAQLKITSIIMYIGRSK